MQRKTVVREELLDCFQDESYSVKITDLIEKNTIFSLNNNKKQTNKQTEKKQPAYLQDNIIFYESGLPKFPVNLYLLQFS